MKKKSIGIIGYGSWAKTVFPTLEKYFNINFIINSKIDFKSLNLDKTDWVFIFTNNESHFDIVRYLLNKKKNIFCEKPLSLSYKKTLYLYELAAKKKCKLYVDDVEYFKNKRLKIKKKNYILRFKMSIKSDTSILFRLAYHDLYLLKNYISIEKIYNIQLLEKSKSLKFSFICNKAFYKFYYRLDSNKKIHKINEVNFLDFKKKPLDIMFDSLNRNKIDFFNNKKRTLFSSKLISLLDKKYI